MTHAAQRRSPGESPRGFTLVEVLIALAIFAMASVILGAAYLNVLTAYQASYRGDRDAADLSFVRSYVMAQSDRKIVENGGEYDAVGGRHVRWSAEIDSTTVPDLFDVTLTCDFSADDAGPAEKIVQHFRLLRPTWSDPTERGKLMDDAKKRIQDLMQGQQGAMHQ